MLTAVTFNAAIQAACSGSQQRVRALKVLHNLCVVLKLEACGQSNHWQHALGLPRPYSTQDPSSACSPQSWHDQEQAQTLAYIIHIV